MTKKKHSNSKVLLASLGKVIHARRLRVKMSQQELADLSGLHRTYISDIERGTRNLTIATLDKIVDALEISMSTAMKQAELN